MCNNVSWSATRTICTTLAAVTIGIHAAASHLPKQVSLSDDIKTYNKYAAIGFTFAAAFPIINYFARKSLTDESLYPVPQIVGSLATFAGGILARPYVDAVIVEATKFIQHYQATSPKV